MPRVVVPLPAPRSRPESLQTWPEALKTLSVAPPATVKLGVFLKMSGDWRLRVPALTAVKPV